MERSFAWPNLIMDNVRIMDNLMDALTAIEYERHVWEFTDRTKAVVTKDHFLLLIEKESTFLVDHVMVS